MKPGQLPTLLLTTTVPASSAGHAVPATPEGRVGSYASPIPLVGVSRCACFLVARAPCHAI